MKKLICLLLFATAACKKDSEPIIYYPDNIIVAHRGAWQDGNCPQNSLASLQKAIEMKCIGSEFDVWLTSDDSLVIEHDEKYAGNFVEKSTYASLAATKLSNGEVLPTLYKYLLTASGQNQTKLFLEIKSLHNSTAKLDKITDKIIKLVHKMQMQDHILYTSFYLYALQRVHQLDPAAKTQYLGGTATLADIKSAGVSGINYSIDSFYKHLDWIPTAKSDSFILGAWTVNDGQQFTWLMNNNFNYVLTDEPKTLFSVLDHMR